MKLILIAFLVLPVLANAKSQKIRVPELAVPSRASMCDMLKYHLKPMNGRLPSGINSKKNERL